MNPEVLPAPGLSDSHELKEDLPKPSLPGTLSLRGFLCGSDLGVFNHGSPRPQSVKMKKTPPYREESHSVRRSAFLFTFSHCVT